MQKEQERQTAGKERGAAGGGGEWDCSLCLVVTARSCIQPLVHLIGLQRVRWVVGEGGASRRGGGKWLSGRGVSRCRGCKTVQENGQSADVTLLLMMKRRLTLTAYPGLFLHQQNGCRWPRCTQHHHQVRLLREGTRLTSTSELKNMVKGHNLDESEVPRRTRVEYSFLENKVFLQKLHLVNHYKWSSMEDSVHVPVWPDKGNASYLFSPHYQNLWSLNFLLKSFLSVIDLSLFHPPELAATRAGHHGFVWQAALSSQRHSSTVSGILRTRGFIGRSVLSACLAVIYFSMWSFPSWPTEGASYTHEHKIIKQYSMDKEMRIILNIMIH